MSVKKLVVCSVLLGAMSIGRAEPLTPDETWTVDPSGQNDRAVQRPGRIPWCEGKFTGEMWDKRRLRRSLLAWADQNAPREPNAESLDHMCQWPDDPTWQKQATVVVQAVMNVKDKSQDEAIDYIKTLIAQEKAETEKESRPQTDEERFEFSSVDMIKTDVGSGIDTAKISGPIPWCDGIKFSASDRWNTGRISRTIHEQYGIEGTVEGALHLCQRPSDTTWKQAAQATLQKWMNWTAQSQADAIASIKTRIQLDKWKTQFEATCKALTVDAEAAGQDRVYARATRRFFGCDDKGEEAWRASSTPDADAIAFYIDADDSPPAIVRIAWLFAQTQEPDPAKLPGNSAFDNGAILRYAIVAHDFDALDAKAIDGELSKAPFNNEYVHTVVQESLAELAWRKKVYESVIDKLGKKGSEYTDVLRTAPKKAFADWDKLTSPWKAELARSYAFEKKLSLPTRKALKGCSKDLYADSQKLIKSYKKKDYEGLVSTISTDPVANLMLSRLAVCYAAEGISGSGAIRDLVEHSRTFRGAHSAAYFALVDALVDAKKSRPNLLISADNFYFASSGLTHMYSDDFQWHGTAPREPEKTDSKGVLKEAKKQGDTVHVVFKTQKFTYEDEDCVSTNRPIRIQSDGTIEYAQNCHPNGKILTQDETPSPVTVDPLLATGIKPGVYGVFSNEAPVYMKKTSAAKTIDTFFGFQL